MPQFISSEASLPRKGHPHHMPHHAALLPGTSPQMVSLPKAAFLPPNKSKFGLGLWLVFHPVCSQPCLFDKEMGRA